MVLEDRYIAPGTKVRRDAVWNDDEHPTSEFGIVVHCWFDDEMGMFDCYIAFFGQVFPEGKPAEMPYILRYAVRGLVEITD
ncbi:hypothetical protein KRR38_18810 [Novosphingobium sp. G106]|uniref:hypothetical protein n=1 Tax=Novosphingobium sp. G106 TaxID=2849500 RepID=UPI001C2DC45A|nr:hypothetical protein [Novosphingobium sp. G106]MBV1689678.1 hypothetical protein [Novosphingobium sp. G106]